MASKKAVVAAEEPKIEEATVAEEPKQTSMFVKFANMTDDEVAELCGRDIDAPSEMQWREAMAKAK